MAILQLMGSDTTFQHRIEFTSVRARARALPQDQHTSLAVGCLAGTSFIVIDGRVVGMLTRCRQKAKRGYIG